MVVLALKPLFHVVFTYGLKVNSFLTIDENFKSDSKFSIVITESTVFYSCYLPQGSPDSLPLLVWNFVFIQHDEMTRLFSPVSKT